MPSPSEIAATLDPAAAGQHTELIEYLVKFLFSGFILAYIAIILSGKFLASSFPGRRLPGQNLRLPLFIMNFQAENEEVIFGMTGFIITLVLVAFVGGVDFYKLFVARFGFDAGHFNTLCIASALFSVIWTASLYLLTEYFTSTHPIYGPEHQNMLNRIQDNRSKET